ncbi:MAG: molybdopterin-guanine dinucleotide biosynthesis protein B [Oscillospiraceae bacterium]|nr:molybdopterin-guanine dinucleotide biosynthesis protein B [Oscillospiraceae bacterium]
MSESLGRNRNGVPVIQFVALSGTGKTTFLEKMVAELKGRGLRVGVYKHDGHDFEIDRPGKDSWRMTQAGADVTVLSSSERAVIMENRPVAPEELADRVSDVDLLLVEGYKTGPWRKIAMRRKASGKDWAIPPESCIAVVTDGPGPDGVPRFGFDDVKAAADFLQKEIDGP